FTAPRTPVEQAIARVWAKTLGITDIGIHDNFFELGGDSILSIQIVSRVRKIGLHITPGMMFRYQTVAELAAHAGNTTNIHAAQGPVNGTAPLTPIQNWFFERDLTEAHHFNQSVHLELETVDPDLLDQALTALLKHHDILRSNYTHTNGRWTQTITDHTPETILHRHDLSQIPPEEQPAHQEHIAEQTQRSLNLTEGPLIQAALLDLGPRNHRLLIAIHHLLVDGVSWRILLEDLGNAYHQLTNGEEITLPLKTSSYLDWANHLEQHAQTEKLHTEIPYWTSQTTTNHPHPHTTPTTLNTTTLTLTPHDTTALLRDVPRAFGTQINDVLLTALAIAHHRTTGNPDLHVDLEGHGREELFDDIDLLRTVGWFTTIFPVHITATTNPTETLKNTQKALENIPNKGIGYGILRYLATPRTRQ
ncbi:condensation domain-containing protein, partial [Kitasatospora sp. NPDC057198]|uniref:condensation domain-containing protein n=1 Tax=Kitasatospora sp. NPDC057198 TaxID=3346046 RepID=UPI00362C67B8